MFKIIYRTTLGMLFLFLIPLIFWLSGWQWHISNVGISLKFLFYITNTVGIFSDLLLTILVLKYLNNKKKPILFLIIMINISILLGEYSNFYIKEKVKEERPYISWIKQNFKLNNETFYKKSKKEQTKIINNVIINIIKCPYWLKKYWIHKTSFSFPSGHTIFVSSWALLMVVLLWPYGYYKTVIAIFTWANIVMISRLLLGMHWVHDLTIGILLSWIIINIISMIIKYCNKDIIL